MRTTVRLLAATIALGGVATQASGAGTVPALPSPGHFVNRVDNPWFPLKPGTVLIYRGLSDGVPARDVFTVTSRTKTIEGIRTTVIDDRVYLRGRLRERTTDWYAQDRAGNVWYLGEKTAKLDANGRVKSTDGTWQAGVDGAHAGIYMPAHPRAGEVGEQEYYKGHAEDRFRVLTLSAHASTPARSTDHALLTEETTVLEPGVVDHKMYARGIGTVVEETIKGGRERFELVSIRHASRRVLANSGSPGYRYRAFWRDDRRAASGSPLG